MIKAASRAALSGLHADPRLHTVFNMASPAERISALEGKRDELLAASQTIIAEGEDDLTDEQNDALATNASEIEKLDKTIANLNAFLPKSKGRVAGEAIENDGAGKPKKTVPAAVRDNARHNFTSMGEFARAVRAHQLGRHETDGVQKLHNAATTYGNEGSGPDGGFLVPPEFSQSIWQKVGEADENLMARCTELTPSGNSMTIPKDETTPWGTSGIQAKVPQIISHKVNTAIVSGTGAGQPLGILNSPSLISVAKETSQPADTVWFANLNKMWSRMYAPWRRNSVWLINQDIEPSLHGMAFQATGASSMLPGTSAVPAYLPMNGLSGSPYATLMGRPVVPLQACKTVGDQGDIVLVDLRQYWILRKAAGLRTDTSMHLYFDQAVTAFRFIFRVNGQPAYSSVVTPENGSNTLSWAVALDAR
jgi:hypothetical protein